MLFRSGTTCWAGGLRARPELHLGAAQPRPGAAGHHLYAVPDEHAAAPAPAAAATGDDDHNHHSAVPAAAAAVHLAGAVLPAQLKPQHAAAAPTAAGARSDADFAATGQLTSPASENHRYTDVP